MNVLNRREFISVLGGMSAVATAGVKGAFGAVDASATTALYVKGLVMVDLGNPDVVRLGFPKAPGHKAILDVIPQTGTKRTLTIKGNGTVDAAESTSANPRIFVPELVRVKELYGQDARTHIDKCPGVISIPSAAIRSVTTSVVSPVRYTFVRSDNGEEVTTFRPRQIADVLKFDLSSASILKLDEGKVSIPLETARELRVQYTPERRDQVDPYADHFHHYLDYVDRPAALDFNVIPKKVGAASSPTPHAGHNFMMLDWDVFCYVIGN